ncbi:MAG TPA: hypothetical protein VLA49_19170 [Anaerolineales bacterium]|nr:hypothetical protein [Anaerolineales bacterium]
MAKRLKIFLLLGLILSVSACSGEHLANRSGSIPMLPFSDTELGFRSTRPFFCNQVGMGTYDCTDLNPTGNPVYMNQLVFEGSLTELLELVAQQIDAPLPPEEIGAYQSAALSWKLYTLEAANIELGPDKFHIQVALAEDETRCYLIALAALPEDYQADQKMYDTIFTHALYAFEPME